MATERALRPLRNGKSIVAEQIAESAALCTALAKQSRTIVQIADLMVKAFHRGNKVLLFGNGGSAADAEHIASELSGRFNLNRHPLPAIALTTNTPCLTAIANDFGYGEVFARQVRGLAVEEDVVVGISTSGTSPNVLRGIEEARSIGAITVAFTGQKGALKRIAQYVLSIDSSSTPRIQEAHMVAGHIICCIVEESLFCGEQPLKTNSTAPRLKTR